MEPIHWREPTKRGSLSPTSTRAWQTNKCIDYKGSSFLIHITRQHNFKNIPYNRGCQLLPSRSCRVLLKHKSNTLIKVEDKLQEIQSRGPELPYTVTVLFTCWICVCVGTAVSTYPCCWNQEQIVWRERYAHPQPLSSTRSCM